jgi:hypothetical protein
LRSISAIFESPSSAPAHVMVTVLLLPVDSPQVQV